MRRLRLMAMAALALLSAMTISASKKAATPNSILTPDFAYPATVRKNADAALQKAIDNADWETAAVATIQSVTARNLVNRDSVPITIAKVDSIANIAPADWSPIFRLVEADIYTSIYASIRWQADSRQLPLDSFPSNPFDWGQGLFARKIGDICAQLMPIAESDTRPLKLWQKTLKNADDAYKYGMTIGEFLASRISSLCGNFAGSTEETIPFFSNTVKSDTPVARCTDLRDQASEILISLTSSQPLLHANAIISRANFLPEYRKIPYLRDAISSNADSETLQPILIQSQYYIGNYESGTRQADCIMSASEYLEIIKNSISRFPKGRYVNGLKNLVAQYSQPYAEVSLMNQYLSGKDIILPVTLANTESSWLLVYDYSKFVNSTNPPKTSVLTASAKPVKAVNATVTGKIPFDAKTEVNIGTLPKGVYVVVPSAKPDRSGIYPAIMNDSWREPFRVSDISIMNMALPDATTRVYVVDGADSRPIPGATVKVYAKKNYRDNGKLSSTLTTNEDGYVVVSEPNFSIKAEYDGSLWEDQSRMYNSKFSRKRKLIHRGQIFTDLALYHPGDSVRFAFVGYQTKDREASLSANTSYEIRLLDSNRKEIASANVITDAQGRASSTFILPKTGMLGLWSLSATTEDGISVCSRQIQVAEYKAPTFFVTSDEPGNAEAVPGDTIRIEGSVMTYSGMPLEGAVVNYTINYTPGFRWFRNPGGNFSSSVTADAKGKYCIVLPTSNLKGTDYSRGIFNVSITATSPAGETQSAPGVRFSLGQEFYISGNVPTKLKVNDEADSVDFSIKALNMLGNEVRKEIGYRLVAVFDSTVFAQGEFTSPNLSLKTGSLPSAVYRLETWLSQEIEEDKDATASFDLTIWRASDTTAPSGTGLWTPVNHIDMAKGQNEFVLTVGEGHPDRWVAVTLASQDSLIYSEWKHIGKDNILITLPAPVSDPFYLLTLKTLDNLQEDSQHVTVTSYEASSSLDIKSETFRDRISAGDSEHWRFRVSRDGVAQTCIPALAVMTDAALNDITPFVWNFSVDTGFGSASYVGLRAWSARNVSQRSILSNFKYLSYQTLSTPWINDYGLDWGLGYNAVADTRFYTLGSARKLAPTTMVRGTGAVMTESSVKNEMFDDALELEEAQVEYEAPQQMKAAKVTNDGASYDAPAETSLSLRDSECPVAFFMPGLMTDSDGDINIEFTVPDFNTTWALQILTYNDRLKTCQTSFRTVASKPVMVQTHAPQFVRTGDHILLTATVFNNSGKDAEISGEIQLVNLLNGKTIASRKFSAESMSDAASRVISMEWNVPSDVSMVGFRAYAEGAAYRDGEQALVPVLPSSSPVVEATPFWLNPDEKNFEIKLPKFNADDKVTLSYCDNPVWYCLTALPEITVPDSKNVLSLVRAYYGNTVAYHLISSNPNLKRGLEVMLSDKDSEFAALKSNLQKDGNLKIADINNTTWVNNAESETLRMSRLASLLDDEEAKKAIASLTDEVRSQQTPDGGWSWCPEMQTSSFMTREVVRLFAMAAKAGALDSSAVSSMIRSGVAYVDADYVDNYHKYHKKGESLSYLMDWIYVRGSLPVSMIPTSAKSKELSSLFSQAIADIAKEWKAWQADGKATAAIVLWREGQKDISRAILESLRQYGAYSGRVLEAFSTISPDSDAVDEIRKKLIFDRQTQDWGTNVYTAETVDAILTSGSDWTAPAYPATVSLGGKTLSLPASAALTGAYTITLDAKKASGAKLKLRRDAASPAWGGVVSQRIAPIAEIKAVDVPDLSVVKSVVALQQNPDGTLIPVEGHDVKVGQKVRVTLTLTAGRDMDYVAVRDERAACLTPTDQLSAYTVSDGVWFYREVRSDVTNLFISHLSKGHHVISYDCYVTQEGDFSCGIATAQSQYSPLSVAHSAGYPIVVDNKK